MIKRGCLFAKLLTVFMLTLAIGVVCPSVLTAEDKGTCEVPAVVRLKGAPDGISPPSVTVKQGDTIVWHNAGKGGVKIIFKTRIGIACTAPVNFYADLLGNYESTIIPEGGTASICLIDKGLYVYETRRLTESSSGPAVEYVVKGKVIVEKKEIL